jgi:hypothetical protein
LEVILSRQRLFAAKVSLQRALALTVAGPTAREQPAKAATVAGPTALEQPMKAASTLEALASAPVDLPRADLERLRAANRKIAPARLRHPAWARGEGSGGLPATS